MGPPDYWSISAHWNLWWGNYDPTHLGVIANQPKPQPSTPNVLCHNFALQGTASFTKAEWLLCPVGMTLHQKSPTCWSHASILRVRCLLVLDEASTSDFTSVCFRVAKVSCSPSWDCQKSLLHVFRASCWELYLCSQNLVQSVSIGAYAGKPFPPCYVAQWF